MPPKRAALRSREPMCKTSLRLFCTSAHGCTVAVLASQSREPLVAIFVNCKLEHGCKK